MKECAFQKKIGRWFDGELPEQTEVLARHVDECPACAEYLNFLDNTRAGVQAVATRPQISDGQFPAFMASLEEVIGHRPTRRHFGGFWALASVGCAALISTAAIASIFVNLRGGPVPVSAATVVESHATELPGATTEVSILDGTTSIMIRGGWGDHDYDTEGDMM